MLHCAAPTFRGGGLQRVVAGESAPDTRTPQHCCRLEASTWNATQRRWLGLSSSTWTRKHPKASGTTKCRHFACVIFGCGHARLRRGCTVNSSLAETKPNTARPRIRCVGFSLQALGLFCSSIVSAAPYTPGTAHDRVCSFVNCRRLACRRTTFHKSDLSPEGMCWACNLPEP